MRAIHSLPNSPARSRARRRSTVRRYIALVGAIAPTLAIAACGGDSDSPTAPTPQTVAGSYAMATARGHTVPHTFTDAAGKKLTIEGGTLTVSADGTYALRYKGKLNALTFDLTDEGTYAMSGDKLTFTPDDGDPSYIGTVRGNAIETDFRIAGVSFALKFSDR